MDRIKEKKKKKNKENEWSEIEEVTTTFCLLFFFLVLNYSKRNMQTICFICTNSAII